MVRVRVPSVGNMRAWGILDVFGKMENGYEPHELVMDSGTWNCDLCLPCFGNCCFKKTIVKFPSISKRKSQGNY